MMYTIYAKTTGQILRTVNCQEDDIGLQFNDDDSAFIIGSYRDDGYYIAGSVAVQIPPQPSPHHIFNYTTKQWEDPRTLADLKAAQWATIKQARSNAEYAGFTWDGSTFDSDAISQQRITGAVTLAQMSPEFVIDWTLADNSIRTLIRAEMVAVGVALGIHVQTQFAKAQGLRVEIEAATTQAEIEAVVW